MRKKNKNKVIQPPSLPPEVADDEIIVSDEDVDFVRDHRSHVNFLMNFDSNSINRHVMRTADQREDNDELEKRYEQRDKKAVLLKLQEEELQVDLVDALPIKTLDGKLEYRNVKISRQEEEDDKRIKDGEEKSVNRLTKAERRAKLKKQRKEVKKTLKEETFADDEKLHKEVLEKVQKDLSAEELFNEKKSNLAEIGMALIEDPESNIKSLWDMVRICGDKDNNIVKLALMSTLAVFKDIIPGYRIRQLTEKELAVRVSKEVQKTRYYEFTLLRSYKAYLQKLVALEKQRSFHQISVRCMCTLLDVAPHFNFRESLLASVVRNLNSDHRAVRKLCQDTVKSLFINEGKHHGEATVEAAQLIATHVKIHDCNLHPDMIEVFLYLKFDEDLKKHEKEEKLKPKKNKHGHKQESKEFQDKDKKKKKRQEIDKTREEVNADFKAVSFAPDKMERSRMQTATLSAVFQTYFRILKHSLDRSESGGSGTHPLLMPCLDGLGKYSHLIDLDFIGELMRCLKKIAGHREHHDCTSYHDDISVSERLKCCIVAFKVMKSNLDALNVDLQEFFTQLYNIILEFRPDRDDGVVLAEALSIMLCEGKQHDTQRAAAFIKRLSTFSLSFGSAEAMAALVAVKQLLQKNSKCRLMLENDASGGSLSGLASTYDPESKDPNLSGALASVLWDLALLSKHYNSSISSMASSILSMGNLNSIKDPAPLLLTSPVQVYKDSVVENELRKPLGKIWPAIRKRKWRESKFCALSQDLLQNMTLPPEDEIKGKLESHFLVLKHVADHESLLPELNQVTAKISLYKENKGSRKKRRTQSSVK